MDERRTETPETPYEAPVVEQVVGPDEVERQVHYAGEATPIF